MAFHDKEASFKAVVYFKDGNSRTFHSYDFPHKNSKERKPVLGFDRLEKMILKFGNKVETAIIYSRENNKEHAKYKEGLKLI